MERRSCDQRVVNTLPEGVYVRVVGEGNDAGVIWDLAVQVMEMAPIVGENGSPKRDSVSQHVRVWNFLVGAACIQGG